MNETDVWFGASAYVLQTTGMPRVPNIPPDEDATANDADAFISEHGFLCRKGIYTLSHMYISVCIQKIYF